MFLRSADVSRTSSICRVLNKKNVVELLKFMERSCYATNTLRQPVEVVPLLILNGRKVPVTAGS